MIAESVQRARRRTDDCQALTVALPEYHGPLAAYSRAQNVVGVGVQAGFRACRCPIDRLGIQSRNGGLNLAAAVSALRAALISRWPLDNGRRSAYITVFERIG